MRINFKMIQFIVVFTDNWGWLEGLGMLVARHRQPLLSLLSLIRQPLSSTQPTSTHPHPHPHYSVSSGFSPILGMDAFEGKPGGKIPGEKFTHSHISQIKDSEFLAIFILLHLNPWKYLINIIFQFYPNYLILI